MACGEQIHTGRARGRGNRHRGDRAASLKYGALILRLTFTLLFLHRRPATDYNSFPDFESERLVVRDQPQADWFCTDRWPLTTDHEFLEVLIVRPTMRMAMR